MTVFQQSLFGSWAQVVEVAPGPLDCDETEAPLQEGNLVEAPKCLVMM